jgi:hypothetical protein
MIVFKKLKTFHIWYTCSQIWLNYFVDDHHFGYITESFKKRIMGPNCPKHIVIVLETFADLDKEIHLGVS